jgi:hypothetical protein
MRAAEDGYRPNKKSTQKPFGQNTCFELIFKYVQFQGDREKKKNISPMETGKQHSPVTSASNRTSLDPQLLLSA